MIIGIVAIAKNYAIGRNGALPWHYPADLKHFRETTTGNAIVMGVNTWKSIGNPLPNRMNIVLSRSENIETQPNLLLFKSEDEVIALSNHLECDVFIIGGAMTYKKFADVIEKWIVTEVPLTVDDADAFMQDDFLDGFSLGKSYELGGGLVVKTFRRRKNLV